MTNEIEQYWNDLKALYELDKEQVKETEAGSDILFSREIQEDNEIKKRYCEVYEALVRFPKYKRYAVIAHQIYPLEQACQEYNKITGRHLDPAEFSKTIVKYYEQLAKHATKISEGIHEKNFEEEEVLIAIAETRSLRGAAKELGTTINTLYKVIEDLGLPKDAEKLQAIIRKKVKRSFKWRQPKMVFKRNIVVPEVSEKELINGIIEHKSIHQYALHNKLSRTTVERWLEHYGFPKRARDLGIFITKYINADFKNRFKAAPKVSKEDFVKVIIETGSRKDAMERLGFNQQQFESTCVRYGIPTRVKGIADYIRENYDKDFKIIKRKNNYKTSLA